MLNLTRQASLILAAAAHGSLRERKTVSGKAKSR